MTENVSVNEMNGSQSSAPKGQSRRQFLRGAAIAGAGLLAVACQPPETVEVMVEVPAEQQILRMWTTRFFNPNINLHLNEEAQNAGRDIGFGVDVQAIPGSFQEFAAKLSAAAEGGTLPDIFSPQIATQTFMRDGRLLPIQEVWDEVGEGLGGWHPTAERNFTLEGVGYALDIGFAPAFMHIREDMVEEAGFSLPFSDLEEMLAFGQAYTNADENLFGLGFAYGLPDDLMHLQPLMWAFGGAAFNEEGDITLDSPENIEALQWYTDLYTVHEVVPPASVNWEGGGNNQGYLTGQIAMAMNPGSILAAVRRGDTPIEDLLDKTYLAPWPQRTAEIGPQAQTEAGQAFGINKETDFPDAAQDVLRHLWSPDVYIKMMQMGQSYLFPALLGAYEDPYFSEDRWNKQVVENVVPIMHDESWPATARAMDQSVGHVGRQSHLTRHPRRPDGSRGDGGSARHRFAGQRRLPGQLRHRWSVVGACAGHWLLSTDWGNVMTQSAAERADPGGTRGLADLKSRLRVPKETVLGVALMIPALAIIIGLIGYPTLYAIWMSLHTKLLAVRDMPFVGLKNYVDVLSQGSFWPALGRTIYFTVVSVGIKTCIGMATALVLNENWPGRGLARAAVLLPWALPPLTAVVTWRFLFNDTTNVLNYILVKAHLIEKPILWLAKAEYAMPSVIIVGVWQGFPFFAITLLAGLSPIPNDLYDAAKVDGAGIIHRFLYVSLPGVFPVLMVAVTLSTIWTFNQFAVIWLLTQGGPGEATTTLPIAAYMQAFVAGSKNLSRGAVFAVLTFPVLVILVLLLNRFITSREETEA